MSRSANGASKNLSALHLITGLSVDSKAVRNDKSQRYPEALHEAKKDSNEPDRLLSVLYSAQRWLVQANHPSDLPLSQ
ncbi:hypothetical protein O7627_36915 [Solwaraspora sp. WMMD1047]|uniref:hypothetical protein n=1 Tax=Solwaraspora sp. WMMD1047 TaxID=3016102 RepID=UPI00241646B0|nr:hypothetical protein [Solwaraspora sp. WMMD1047]MDG4834853.1 hypothetical protein [Solwaraspora sp. WMMD1047]